MPHAAAAERTAKSPGKTFTKTDQNGLFLFKYLVRNDLQDINRQTSFNL
jgi:hypothetical protein